MTVVNLALIKSHIDVTREANDNRIQLVLDAALGMVTDIVGPISGSASARVTSDGTTMVLPSIPVVSVTSIANVVDPDSPIDSGDYTVDTVNGFIYDVPPGTYDVIYVGGWASTPNGPDLPGDMAAGIVELVRNMWAPYRGNTVRGTSTSPSDPAMLAIYGWAVDRFARYRTVKVI